MRSFPGCPAWLLSCSLSNGNQQGQDVALTLPALKGAPFPEQCTAPAAYPSQVAVLRCICWTIVRNSIEAAKAHLVLPMLN